MTNFRTFAAAVACVALAACASTTPAHNAETELILWRDGYQAYIDEVTKDGCCDSDKGTVDLEGVFPDETNPGCDLHLRFLRAADDQHCC